MGNATGLVAADSMTRRRARAAAIESTAFSATVLELKQITPSSVPPSAEVAEALEESGVAEIPMRVALVRVEAVFQGDVQPGGVLTVLYGAAYADQGYEVDGVVDDGGEQVALDDVLAALGAGDSAAGPGGGATVTRTPRGVARWLFVVTVSVVVVGCGGDAHDLAGTWELFAVANPGGALAEPPSTELRTYLNEPAPPDGVPVAFSSALVEGSIVDAEAAFGFADTEQPGLSEAIPIEASSDRSTRAIRLTVRTGDVIWARGPAPELSGIDLCVLVIITSLVVDVQDFAAFRHSDVGTAWFPLVPIAESGFAPQLVTDVVSPFVEDGCYVMRSGTVFSPDLASGVIRKIGSTSARIVTLDGQPLSEFHGIDELRAALK